MIDHVILNVSDYDAARAFYSRALSPLGVSVAHESAGMLGLGSGGDTPVWIAARGEPSTSVHLALRAPSRDAVDAFHAAGLEAGGRDNGAPGLRPD